MTIPTPLSGTRFGAAVGVRIPRFEQIVGCRPDQISAETLTRLVGSAVGEDLVLEYKASLYEKNADGVSELAKDVAALANAVGGVIVIGIREDSQGRADELSPVPLSDNERLRMVDVLVKHVAPLIPELFVRPIAVDSDGTRGVYVIAVPASPAAPHAVVKEHRFMWPVREDTQTRWMREPEFAYRYRERFAGTAARAAVLDDVFADGTAALRRRVSGWLAIAMVPDRAGSLTISRSALDASRAWLRDAQAQLPSTALSSSTAGVGRRRVVLGSNLPHSPLSDDWRLELHADGSAFGAIALGEPRVVDERPSAAIVFALEDIEVWVVQVLGLLSRHAVRAGAGGDLVIRATLLGAAVEEQALWTAPNGRTFSVGGIGTAIEDVRTSGGIEVGHQIVAGSRVIGTPHSTTQVTTLGVVTDNADLVATSASIVIDLVSEFGIPEPRFLRTDGTVAVGNASSRSATFTSWASSHGLAR